MCKIQLKLKILTLLVLITMISTVVPHLSSASPDVSRRSFLGMLGAALGTAAVGPNVTFLADKVLVTNVGEAQKLMQIRSSLDFDFLRRSAWERYLTGRVTVNPAAGEVAALENYRAQLLKFISNPSTSSEGQQLARVLINETNNFFPFDISPKEYVQRAKSYFEEQRIKTLDLRSEEVINRVEDGYDRVYREANLDFETKFEDFEMEVSTVRCNSFLR